MGSKAGKTRESERRGWGFFPVSGGILLLVFDDCNDSMARVESLLQTSFTREEEEEEEVVR